MSGEIVKKHKHRDHEKETDRNREEVLKRPRMWATVDSEEEDNKDGYHSDSSSTSSSSSSSSSSEEEKKKKKKKEKSSKKEKSNKHKKEKKHKKDKKERKHKKSKKSSSEKASSKSLLGAVNQNEYGKYGIIREQDYFKKQREFEVYMDEIKHMPGIIGQGKREIMEHFKEFCEDYNTATMPNTKYYNLERWEMEQYRHISIVVKFLFLTFTVLTE